VDPVDRVGQVDRVGRSSKEKERSCSGKQKAIAMSSVLSNLGLVELASHPKHDHDRPIAALGHCAHASGSALNLFHEESARRQHLSVWLPITGTVR
jgi:hypothetical protein